jgi:hypothetical protein
VGDVIRVVATLGDLSDDEIDLVAALLPQPPEPPAVARPPLAASPPAAVPWPSVPAPAGGGRGGAGGERRRSARRVALARAALGRMLRVPKWPRWAGRLQGLPRWWLAVAFVAAAAPVAVSLTGILPRQIATAVVEFEGVAVGVSLLVFALRGLVAWRRSPLLRSSATWSPAAVGTVATGSGRALDLGPTGWSPPPPAPPLVPEGRQRALAMALARSFVPGPLDVRRMVEDRARRQARTAPPRQVLPSVRRGVQVVVDRGPALDPFRNDVASLVAALVRVASANGVEVLAFTGDPRWVVPPWRRGTGPPAPQPYQRLVPTMGRAVVVVSDLGIATARSAPAPAPPRAWTEHHAVLRRAGCPVVYLVPYPVARWPQALAGHLPAVVWHEGLRLDEVARAADRSGTRP